MVVKARSVAVMLLVAGSLLACGDDPSTLGTAGGRTTSSSSGSTSSSGSSGGSSGVVGTGDSLNEVCWSTINAHRAKDGLPPLTRWTEAESCSDGEARSDGEKNQPHGSFPKCGEFAQNECPGFDGPADTAIPDCLGFMYAQPKGEGHHDNMASTKWTKVACGTFVTTKGSVWSVQNYR